MSNPYDKMTEDEFFSILEDIVNEMPAGQLLLHGDVYSTLKEEYNNEVLDRWKDKHPEYFNE